ncbi:IS1182 family transposase [Thiotrichales bacterium 19S3-7]|nr:IS1182 family transposase [Thiotrichales bacterium 19S3-7]MCF6803036.1 IS1182 family transposase [Thiotrichales bacterium 19S3-11]
MSLKLSYKNKIPAQTVRIAKSAFPKGNPYITLRDHLGTIFEDIDFMKMFPKVGQPALQPWRLALLTVIQHGENLSDRQTAEAVRARIDLKYLLGLNIDDSGFDYSVLSEFRKRLVEHKMEELLLSKILDVAKSLKIIKTRGHQRTDSTRVLMSVKELNRYEVIGETMRSTLNHIAVIEPVWLKSIVPYEWYDRYHFRFENYRLPTKLEDKNLLMQVIGKDAHTLIKLIEQDDTPYTIKTSSKVGSLRTMLARHFHSNNETYEVIYKTNKEAHQSEAQIESPYDIEARYRTKRQDNWSGYTVHLTETCDNGFANIITNVCTTTADVHDSMTVNIIHDSLKNKHLLPEKHLVDSAYMSAVHLYSSKLEFDVELVGPVRSSRKPKNFLEGSYTVEDFDIQWANKKIICPNGKESSSWRQTNTGNSPEHIDVVFRAADCKKCLNQKFCTQTKSGRKKFNLLEEKFYTVNLEARNKMKTDEQYKKTYRKRSGIEGTISNAVNMHSLRKSRYVGLQKTHLQEISNAAAININRIANWLSGKTVEKTRISKFYQLKLKAA